MFWGLTATEITTLHYEVINDYITFSPFELVHCLYQLKINLVFRRQAAISTQSKV